MSKVPLDDMIDTWLEETKWFSSTTQMIEHPSFKLIKKDMAREMTKVVFALRDRLEISPNIAVMAALGHILNFSPVADEHRGMVEEMRQDWLDWFETLGELDESQQEEDPDLWDDDV